MNTEEGSFYKRLKKNNNRMFGERNNMPGTLTLKISM